VFVQLEAAAEHAEATEGALARLTADNTRLTADITRHLAEAALQRRAGELAAGRLDTVRCKKVASRRGRGFGWEIAHAAITRRPPISLEMVVARTGGYAHDVGVWDLSVVQGPFSVAPCQALASRFAVLSSLYASPIRLGRG
jgi:hypothetical protein